jgi:phage FluMu protein Com
MKTDLRCHGCNKKLAEIIGSDYELELVCKRCGEKNLFHPGQHFASVSPKSLIAHPG